MPNLTLHCSKEFLIKNKQNLKNISTRCQQDAKVQTEQYIWQLRTVSNILTVVPKIHSSFIQLTETTMLQIIPQV